LEIERVNSKKFQDAFETERRRAKELSLRQAHASDELRKELTDIRQRKTELEVALQREKIITSNLESELETERTLKADAKGKILYD